MIKCSICDSNYINNTIFCDECGNCLLEDAPRETDPLETVPDGWLGNGANGSDSSASVRLFEKPKAIRLKIGPRRRQLEISLNRVINIGRLDPALDVFPEIDLSQDGPTSRSVSRRHAIILKQDNSVLVEDVGSFNGTFVNGKRLDPYLPETLVDGDTLQIGKMLIEIEIKRS